MFFYREPQSSDPYAANVSLLLKGDGADGSTSFIDSSGNNLTVVKNGAISISNLQSKFGGTSIKVDNTGYLNIDNTSALQLGTGDYTIETWMYYAPSVSGYSFIFSLYNPNTGESSQLRFGDSGFGNRLQFNAGGGFNRVIGLMDGGTPYTKSSFENVWRHVAVVRNSGVVSIFVDGQQASLYNGGPEAGNFSMSHDLSAAVLLIGGTPSGLHFIGYLDDFRITKGVARYTANFTPPTAF